MVEWVFAVRLTIRPLTMESSLPFIKTTTLRLFTNGFIDPASCVSLIQVKDLYQTARKQPHCSVVSDFAATMHFSRLIANLAAFTGLAIAKPEIVIVPGAWQIEPSWALFRSYLKKAGYNVSQVTLPSVGVSLTGLDTDVSATQAVIDPLLEEGKEVVVLCHSMGGLVAANSMESRDIASRSVGGLEGGIIQLIYLAAFITPAGYSLFNLMGNGYFDWMLVEV